jgi:hypothetical protein
MKPLSRVVKKHVARHRKKLASHSKRLKKAVVRHHRLLTRTVMNEIRFALILVFVALTILLSGFTDVGKFIAGYEGQSFVVYDDFTEDAAIPSSNNFLAFNSEWAQFSRESVYAQTEGVMKATSLGLSKPSFAVLRGYNWYDYSARYDATAGGSYPSPAGGFAVRFWDESNYIAIQPFIDRQVLVWKYRDGDYANDIQILYLKTNGGWPEGVYSIETSGNRYSVKVDGITYLTFEDSRADFLDGLVGFYMAPNMPPSEQMWDNLRIVGR